MLKRLLSLMFFGAFVLQSAGAFAGKPPAPAAPSEESAPAAEEDEGPSAFEKAGIKPKVGPEHIKLGKGLQLDLPDGYAFLDEADSKKFAKLLHNSPDDRVLGTVIPAGANWFVEIAFDKEGYVKDDEADKLDADAILKSYKDGTEEDNKRREREGFKPIHVGGWAEPPRYEKASHHVVWGLKVLHEDGSSGVNYNTRVLGRYGVASLNLIGSLEDLPRAKPTVEKLLQVTTFEQGSRYEDFQASTDRVAEYGLAALVAGGVGIKLAKVGLFAKFGAVLAKGCAAGGKAIIVLILGAFAAIKRFFTGKGTPPSSGGTGSGGTEGGASGGTASDASGFGGGSSPTAGSDVSPTGNGGDVPPTG